MMLYFLSWALQRVIDPLKTVLSIVENKTLLQGIFMRIPKQIYEMTSSHSI
jgi:hypothetical protein